MAKLEARKVLRAEYRQAQRDDLEKIAAKFAERGMAFDRRKFERGLLIPNDG